MTPDRITAIQSILGYSFEQTDLLTKALTHSSAGGINSYERLEFLGDRVLGLIIAELLYARFPQEKEGDLAKRLAALVQGSLLANVAQNMGLGEFIILSESEKESGGAENAHILADIFESLIGAIYLDSGGMNPCRALIHAQWESYLDTMKKPPQHPKTALQEWAQGRGLPLPSYNIDGQSGPDHAPIFKIRLNVQGYAPVFAEEKSRQAGERKAAKAFMDQLSGSDKPP